MNKRVFPALAALMALSISPAAAKGVADKAIGAGGRVPPLDREHPVGRKARERVLPAGAVDETEIGPPRGRRTCAREQGEGQPRRTHGARNNDQALIGGTVAR